MQYHVTTENIVRPKLISQQNMLIDGKDIFLDCETWLWKFQMAIKINKKLLKKPNTKISQFNFYTEMDQGSAAVNDILFIDVKSSLRLI